MSTGKVIASAGERRVAPRQASASPSQRALVLGRLVEEHELLGLVVGQDVREEVVVIQLVTPFGECSKLRVEGRGAGHGQIGEGAAGPATPASSCTRAALPHGRRSRCGRGNRFERRKP